MAFLRQTPAYREQYNELPPSHQREAERLEAEITAAPRDGRPAKVDPATLVSLLVAAGDLVWIGYQINLHPAAELALPAGVLLVDLLVIGRRALTKFWWERAPETWQEGEPVNRPE